MATSLRNYYRHSRTCHVRSIALMAVKTCSKAILELSRKHGKSPCFFGVGFLQLLGVDAKASEVVCFNGADFLECAFCYG